MASNKKTETAEVASSVDVMIINTSPYICYVDLDGNYETPDDILVVGSQGSVKASLTEERIEALKTEKPELVIKRLGA
jgi:hypothetical protein